MSDSSSSDDEASRFREVCDPTLWRTVTQGVSRDERCRVEVTERQQHHHSQGDLRQSFILLEKIRTSLANSQGMTACDWLRHKDDPGTQGKQAGRKEARPAKEALAAPSTLSPFLAKQLTSQLDRSVEYQPSQEENKLTMGGVGSSGQHLHQPLCLLNNLPLDPLVSITPTSAPATKSRAARVPKRLTIFDGSDGKLKTQCQSVAVSPEWILSGKAAYPWPHPKNVRYLEKYKFKERRADGSIIAVPCSLPDNAITAMTTTFTTTAKKRKRKGVACVSQSKKEGNTKIKQEKTLTTPQNGDVTSNSNMRKQRKQARKRGKKKKLMIGDEMATS